MTQTRKGAARHTDTATSSTRDGGKVIVLPDPGTSNIAAHGMRPSEKDTRQCPACRAVLDGCQYCGWKGRVEDPYYDVIRLQKAAKTAPLIQ